MDLIRKLIRRSSPAAQSPTSPSETPVVAPSSSTTKPATEVEVRTVRMAHYENVDFAQLEPSDLRPVAVVAQALDNQWVSRALLDEMLRTNKDLQDIAHKRVPVVRAEYLRSLINAEQVVMNRVFLYNTDVVRADYQHAGPGREAFKTLLARGVIVPYLYREPTPIHAPENVTVQGAFDEWMRVCSEVQTQCVRLSWDDSENQRKIRGLVGRFRAWAQTINQVATDGDISTFMRDVNVPAEQRAQFEERLRAIARWAVDADVVSREALYKQFVLADAPDAVLKGMYDSAKPFSKQIKQLADLSYNTNLPDALGRYALTPIDSLPRTALQELAIRVGQAARPLRPEELQVLLQRTVFDLIEGGEFVSSMGYLSLPDVLEIRDTDEWKAYIGDLQGLLESPLEFNVRAPTIYNRYIALAGAMTQQVRNTPMARLERWIPAVTLVITIGGAVLSAIWNPTGIGTGGQIMYNMVGSVGEDVCGVVARLIIGGISDRRSQAALEASIDFMHGRVERARELWQDLEGQLRSTPGFNAAQERPAVLSDGYDPNINYSQDVEINLAAA